MEFKLMSITGLESALASTKFTRRTWTPEWDSNMRAKVHEMFDRNGFYRYESSDGDARTWINKQLEILAKIGAGVGDAFIDAGHETLFRFIDFEVVVIGLHRAAQDDLDAHAMRMNNRIVRSSSRVGDSTNTDIFSDWYRLRVLSFDELFKLMHEAATDSEIYTAEADPYEALPDRFDFTINNAPFAMVKTPHGYIREDLVNNGDAQRGLYHLAMASNCIFKVDLHDMRHIYKRRNSYTHANPELAAGIESLAAQIKEHLPILGELVTSDYCDDGKLHHIMDISKHYMDRPFKQSSLINENAASFGK